VLRIFRVCALFKQESAEEEQSAVSPAVRVDQRKNVPNAMSQVLSRCVDSAQSAQGAAVTAVSSETRPSAAPVLSMCVFMLQTNVNKF